MEKIINILVVRYRSLRTLSLAIKICGSDVSKTYSILLFLSSFNDILKVHMNKKDKYV